MAKHRIYIREDIEHQLANLAKRSGISTRELIRTRIESLSAEINVTGLKDEIRRCQIAISGVLQILEILVPEIAVASSLLRSNFLKDHDVRQVAQDDVKRVVDATQAIVTSLINSMRKDGTKGGVT